VSGGSERLFQLYAKADAFFERVHSRHAADMECAAGCHDCCAPGLTVTAVEALAIRHFLRACTERPARAGRADRCAALGADGRCTIYPVRPLVCRTHGVPLRPPADPKRHLPVSSSCSKNFKGARLSAVAPSEILDQSTLSTLLFAVDAAFAAEQGAPQSPRVPVADLLDDG
jgi:hypothetical protein